MDLTPLRQSRDYRLLFFSGVVTYLGSMITYVALPFQVAHLTDSYLAVGLIYIVINACLSALAGWLERRQRRARGAAGSAPLVDVEMGQSA